MKRLCFVIVASWICFVISPFVPSQDDVALAGTKITYEPFVSTLYPYRLLQPSSFRHVVLVDLNGHMVDYFYPALGSSVTNVNIFEDEHGEMRDEGALMRASGASWVHVSGYIPIGGKRFPIVSGDRSGLPGRWREEYVEFSASRKVWHLTMSYLLKYRSMRPTMVHMLGTFQRQ
ncbi:MAG: hypothetical protein NVS2B16_19770 [Chloroflexota bacterium]